MDRIPRTGLEAELRLLIRHRDGVQGARELDLPLLREHPAVIAEMASSGDLGFENGLREALSKVLEKLGRSWAEVLRWEFGIAEDSVGLPPSERTDGGLKRAHIGEHGWRHDSRDLARKAQRTRALERVVILLDGVTESDSGTGTPSDTGEKRAGFTHDTSHPDPSKQTRCIRIGRLEIGHAIQVASCDKGQSSVRELLLEFEKDLRPSRADPDEWSLLEAQLLPVLQEEAKKRIAKFEDDPGLDLVHVEHRPSTADGSHRLKIGVAETGYYLWAATANSLDRDLRGFPDLTGCLRQPTLRQGWNSDPSSLADLTRQPAPAYIGVCVVVVAEGKMMVLKRQSDHFVASTSELIPTHFVGEGMEPRDVDGSGRFSPEEAARRGCSEELGVGPDHFQFTPTGVIVDTKRWQPLFCFIAECNLAIPRLERCMKQARDRYETAHGEIAACLPWTVNDERTLALLTGDDPTFLLASNHAQAALLHALYYADGRETVDDLLERDTP